MALCSNGMVRQLPPPKNPVVHVSSSLVQSRHQNPTIWYRGETWNEDLRTLPFCAPTGYAGGSSPVRYFPSSPGLAANPPMVRSFRRFRPEAKTHHLSCLIGPPILTCVS